MAAMKGLSGIGLQLVPADVSLDGVGVNLASTGVSLPVAVPSVVTGGPIIILSSATIAHTATIGTTIGTLLVINGTGSYTFTLTSNPGTLFAISGANLNVAAALTAGSDPISIKADNGAGSTVTLPLSITVS